MSLFWKLIHFHSFIHSFNGILVDGQAGPAWVGAWDGAWVHGGVDVVVVFYKTIFAYLWFPKWGQRTWFLENDKKLTIFKKSYLEVLPKVNIFCLQICYWVWSIPGLACKCRKCISFHLLALTLRSILCLLTLAILSKIQL